MDNKTFLERIDIKGPDECWEWTAGCVKYGYGRIKINKKSYKAHRLAYEHFVGPVGDLYVCHKCDNPKCCNPKHLFLGTVEDNNRDKAAKGRTNVAKLTKEAVIEIRKLAFQGVSCRDLSKRYKVTRTTIRDTVKKKFWKHVD